MNLYHFLLGKTVLAIVAFVVFKNVLLPYIRQSVKKIYIVNLTRKNKISEDSVYTDIPTEDGGVVRVIVDFMTAFVLSAINKYEENQDK